MGTTEQNVKNSQVGQVIKAQIDMAVTKSVADPNVQVEASTEGKQDVIEAVFKNIIPIIAHSTSQEPWYRSRVFWSAAVSVGGFAVGLFGKTLDADMQKQITDLIMMGSQAAAAILALWGRYSTKPLGK